MRRFVLGSIMFLFVFTATASVGQGVSRQDYTGLDKYLPQGRPDNYSFVGIPAAEFLTFPAEARGVGMGDAFSAVSEGASSLWWNPAGMGFTERYETSISHFQYMSGMDYSYLSVAIPLIKDKLTAGAVFGYLGKPDVRPTTMLHPEGMDFDAYQYQLGGSLAYRPYKSFSLGLTLKRVQQDMFGDISMSGVAVDFGARYRFEFERHQLNLSFAALNYGTDLETEGPTLFNEVGPDTTDNMPSGYTDYGDSLGIDRVERFTTTRTHKYELPSSYSLGVAYSLRLFGTGGVTFAYEYNKPRTYENNLYDSSYQSVGMEFNYPFTSYLSAAVRSGWRIASDNTPDIADDFGYSYFGDYSDETDFRVGAGIEAKLKGALIRFDYAHRDWDRRHWSSLNQDYFSLGVGI